MCIKKKFFIGIFTLVLSNFAYAEMITSNINGYTVDYYVPNIAKATVPENMQMNLKVLIKDPSPLPDNYLPPRMNSILMQDTADKATATNFTIDYIANGGTDAYGELCYDFPEEAKVNFEAAAAIWANHIDTGVPITIQACWANFEGSTLGYSGGYSLANYTNAPIADTYYKMSLANSFAGEDIYTNYHDMYITYNSAFAWYYGVDGNTPSDKMDLLTVVLHEMAHGLNFSGNMSYASGYGSYDTYPGVYDRLVVDDSGNPLLNITNDTTEMGDALTSGNLYFNGTHAKAANASNPVKIYTPSTWNPGSSYSHLDYDTFNNTSNQLMVYAVSAGEAIHTPGDITLGMFEDMGWDMAASASDSTGVNPAIILYLLN